MAAFSDEFLNQIRAAISVSEVVERKVKLKRVGSEWSGISPFNPKEKTASFTVNDEKQFYHCFSTGEHGDVFSFMMKTDGMDFRAAVEECATMAGIPIPKDEQRRSSPMGAGDAPFVVDENDVPPISAYEADMQASVRAPAPNREITKIYDYAPRGELLYQVCRMEWEEDGRKKKTFVQRRPHPDGGWIWGLKEGTFVKSRKGDWYQLTKDREKWKDAPRATFGGVDHALYRLLELKEETELDDIVVIPEGEKDVETWREWGIAATTNSGGARHWTDAHAEEFRGRKVVIPIDNDDAGRARADILGKSLRNHGAKSIAVIDFAEFWKDAPKGADSSDWKVAFPGLKASQLLERAKPWTPPAFVSKFGGYPIEDIDLPGPEHEYVVDGWMTVGDKSVIGGPSKSGKSFLAAFEAWCIATGQPFFGNKILAPGLVIYQAGEGVRGIKKRFRALRQQFGKKGQKVPIFILQSKIDLYSPQGDTTNLIAEIKAIAEHYGIPLRAVFIDTLATASGGADENSGRDMAAVMSNIDKIAQAVPGAHVCLVHHMNAGGTKLRGHTSIYANIDQVVLVTKDEESKVRTAVLDKQKDDEDGGTIRFELHQVELGRRVIDGKPITSCVTVPAYGSQTIKVKDKGPGRTARLSDSQQLIFSSLKRAVEEHGVKTPPELKLPKSIRVVTTWKQWKAAYLAVASDMEDNTVNVAMKRASEKFQNLRIIGRINPYVWLTDRAESVSTAPVGMQGNTDAGPPMQEDFSDDMDFTSR